MKTSIYRSLALFKIVDVFETRVWDPILCCLRTSRFYLASKCFVCLYFNLQLRSNLRRWLELILLMYKNCTWSFGTGEFQTLGIILSILLHSKNWRESFHDVMRIFMSIQESIFTTEVYRRLGTRVALFMKGLFLRHLKFSFTSGVLNPVPITLRRMSTRKWLLYAVPFFWQEMPGVRKQIIF